MPSAGNDSRRPENETSVSLQQYSSHSRPDCPRQSGLVRFDEEIKARYRSDFSRDRDCHMAVGQSRRGIQNNPLPKHSSFIYFGLVQKINIRHVSSQHYNGITL